VEEAVIKSTTFTSICCRTTLQNLNVPWYTFMSHLFSSKLKGESRLLSNGVECYTPVMS